MLFPLLAFLILAQPTTRSASPIEIERVEMDGPVRGVLARVDLTDPRVSLAVHPAGDDPDGDGPMTTTLNTVRAVAQTHDLELAINGSFFAHGGTRQIGGRTVKYFVGNPARSIGWLVSDGVVHGRPTNPERPTFCVYADGRAEIRGTTRTLPEGVRFAVDGSGVLLARGVVRVQPGGRAEPRTAVGLDADGDTLFLLTVDGRRDGHSVGVTLFDLAQILQDAGAANAMNLDGGGSTTMVLEEPANTFTVLNRPSDGSGFFVPLSIERAVADVIGVDVALK